MHETGAKDAPDMAARVAAHPWEATPLGPRERWPQALRTLVDTILAAPVPYVLGWGPQLTCLYNDACRPLLGRKPEALGRPFLDVWWEAEDVISPLIDDVWQGGSAMFEDFRFVLQRSGKPDDAYFDFSFSPIYDADGAVAGLLNMAVETTRRVNSDRQRRESERRLAAVLEQMPVGVAIAGFPKGELIYHNTRAVDLLGHPVHPSEDTSGYARYGAVHEDGTPYAAEDYPIGRAVLTGDTVDCHIMRYRRGDGRETCLEVSAARIHDSVGRPVLAVSTFNDISARRAAERALHEGRVRLEESERRLRSLIEGIPQLVWRAVGAGTWTWASPQWTEITGLSEADSCGHGWLQAIHPDDRPRTLEMWQRAAAGGSFTHEARLGPADGSAWRWYRTRATPVRDAAGVIVEWLGTCTDIDDLRRMQDQQEVMVGELQHRTRNLLAIVQSIASQTAGLSESLDSFEARFSDRLSALSRVQGLLSEGRHEAVTIGDVVRLELDALAADLDGDRIACGGPDVPLRKRAVQTLSLALHELATNARKHGALSGPAGRLDVHWRIHDTVAGEHRLELDWTESGVALPAPAPEGFRRGYGRRLIERALPYSLGARTTFTLDEHGLRCRIDLPLTLKDNREVAG